MCSSPPVGPKLRDPRRGRGYRHVLVDNRDPVLMQEVLTSAAAALDAGHPVPISVGGDTRGGLDAAAPRHVVLLTGYADGAFTVYGPRYAPVTARRRRSCPRG